MSLQSISNTTSVSANQDISLSSQDGFQYLTGESLLTYCQTRLQDLDGDIQARMGDQKASLARRQAVQTATQVFKSFGDKGPQTQAEWDKCEAAINAAIAALPPGDSGIRSLQDFRTQMEGQYCKDIAPDPHFPKDGEWKGTIDGLNNITENIKSSSEIEMLQLQQLMSQRQTAVQLTTGMCSKMDQTTDSIVKNI